MKLTKRNIPSTIATIFDPLQFLAPFTLRAKVLMQEIWIAGIGWDDLLTDGLIFKWKKWVSELRELSQSLFLEVFVYPVLRFVNRSFSA
jgi:hypothetical protein